MELSIIILTMNRKNKVCVAIESCLKSKLPKETEFIIVDNGSNDGTEKEVRNLLDVSTYDYEYIRFEKNTGASHGRNEAISIARGRYLFFLDDDACIAEEYYDNFFMIGISRMDNHNEIGALTTSIWDVSLDKWRIPIRGKHFTTNKYVYEVHGGSCFVRNKVLDVYFPDTIMYGYEEVYMCIKLLDTGYYNEEIESIVVNHIPEISKWIDKSGKTIKEHYIKAFAGLSSVKFMLYPAILKPLIWIGFFLRWVRYMGFDMDSFKRIMVLHHEQCDGVSCKKVKFSTILWIAREFGFLTMI